MRDFRIIFKILSIFKNALHDGDNPYSFIEPEQIGTTESHINRLLDILCDAKLLKRLPNGGASITLVGLEYLKDNPTMQEIAKEK